jgi:predicted SAM-dependent methyltransferase
MERRDRILAFIDKSQPGIEIGSSHAPIAPKSEGFRTEIIDHLPADKLRKKYSTLGDAVANIEEVDYVWSGENYRDLVGHEKFYKWIIASHVIEHTPDLISFLNGCSQLLENTGLLVLAIPDKRFCFDRLRQPTSLAQVVDAHLEGRTRHSLGTIYEYYSHVASCNGKLAWSHQANSDLTQIHSDEHLSEALKKYDEGEYIDVHSWCFFPSHFTQLLHRLNQLGFTDLKISTCTKTFGHEFFVVLKKGSLEDEEIHALLLPN